MKRRIPKHLEMRIQSRDQSTPFPHREKQLGTSFIEILIVVAIIGILMSIVIPNYLRSLHRAEYVSDFEEMARLLELNWQVSQLDSEPEYVVGVDNNAMGLSYIYDDAFPICLSAENLNIITNTVDWPEVGYGGFSKNCYRLSKKGCDGGKLLMYMTDSQYNCGESLGNRIDAVLSGCHITLAPGDGCNAIDSSLSNLGTTTPNNKIYLAPVTVLEGFNLLGILIPAFSMVDGGINENALMEDVCTALAIPDNADERAKPQYKGFCSSQGTGPGLCDAVGIPC